MSKDVLILAREGDLEGVKDYRQRRYDRYLLQVGMALQAAAREGHLPIVIYITSQDTDLDLKDVLLAAAFEGHLEVVKYLVSVLRQRAFLDPIGVQESLNKALVPATFDGYLEVSIHLLSQGADPRDNTALKVAIEEGQPELVELLLDMATEPPEAPSDELLEAISISKEQEKVVAEGLKSISGLSKLVARYY